MEPWIYQNQVWEPPKNWDPEIYYGFVYLITNRFTDRKYVGKKFFWSKKTLPPLKGRKNKRRSVVESDWKSYYGSNKHLKEDVEKHGHEAFYREIIHLCKTKGECAYMEAKEQFERDVLLKEDYYNGIIACKIGAPTVRNLAEKNSLHSDKTVV